MTCAYPRCKNPATAVCQLCRDAACIEHQKKHPLGGWAARKETA